MSKNLLIVESPAKAKTIEKILGKDFQVNSCYGHIRDLEKTGMGIDIENDFEPGDVVAIIGPEGSEMARGIANYSSADATKLIGKQSADIERLASTRNYDAFVTRDNIAFTSKNHE